MKTLVKRAISNALSQVGVREERSNRGKEVTEYLASVGLRPGNPWCIAFIYWCINEAAEDLDQINPFIKTGYTPYLTKWAKDRNIIHSRPVEGDVFAVYGRSSSGIYRAVHGGFVTNVNGNRFNSIEGNTNLDGSSEGIGVFKRSRPITRSYRFVRWEDLIEEEDTKIPTFLLVISGKSITAMPVKDGRAMCPIAAWARALGFRVTWNNDLQVPIFNGKPALVNVANIGGVKHAHIRELVQAAGDLQVAVRGREVHVTRKGT